MKYLSGKKCVNAIYSEQRLKLYRGNPCIEALPDSPTDEELFYMMHTNVPMDDINMLQPFERKECVESLDHVFIPIGQTIEVARKIFIAMNQGYVSRNPLTEIWKHDVAKLQSAMIEKNVDFLDTRIDNAIACGFCLIGDSGLGKSSIVNHILGNIPQVIERHEYKGIQEEFTQLTWLKFDCPHDASIKGLCTSFFEKYDEALGDNMHIRISSGRASQNDMISRMSYLAKKVNLGLLVIDEIQNLSAGKSGGSKMFKNLLTQIVNMLGIPILLVGTPSSITELATDLITIRRSCGQQGMSVLHPMAAKSYEWETFIRGIWNYQWTKKKADFSDELADLIYDCSFGNMNLTVSLFKEAQIIAINTGEECINANTIKAAKESSSFRIVLNRLKMEHDAMDSLVKKSHGNKDISQAVGIINDLCAARPKIPNEGSQISKKEKKKQSYDISDDLVKQDEKY